MTNRRMVSWLFLCLGIAAGCTSSVSPTSPIATSQAPSAASATATPALPSASLDALPSKVDIESAGALRIAATGNVDWLVVVDGLAWVTGLGAGIESVDATGTAKQSVRLDGSCESLDVGFDAIWSASCEPAGIIRIDPKTGAVTRKDFDVPIADSEASVGAAEGGVWIVAGAESHLLLQIDPETLEVTNRYAIPAGSAAVRAGLGGIWITRPRADELLHVDPSSGAVVATIAVGPAPVFLAVGEGSVWVMNQGDGTVTRVDPATDTVSATIDVGAPIRGGDIAVGGGSVWVRGGPELLARIDPAVNLVTERYGPDSGSGSVAADDDAVWVTAHDVSKIWRLPLTSP